VADPHTSTYSGPGAEVVVPLNTDTHRYPFRLPCRFAGKSGFLVLDQLRVIDRERMVKRVGRLAPQPLALALKGLQEMFAP